MMEPLGATASIVSLLQLAGAVIKYLSILKDASHDIKALILELCTIRGLLSTIKDLITEESILHESLGGPDGLFSQIESSLQALASKVEPTSTTTAHKFVQKLRWPLQKDEVKDVLSSIERQKTLLSLALQNDQIYLSRHMLADVSEIDQGVKELRVAQQDAKHRRIIRRLSPPDPSTNHSTACQEHSPTTGSWFIDSENFQSWWNNPNEWLWIHGLPGCGKSVLASTIIEHTQILCEDQSGYSLLYFYFDFRQDNKQTLDGFLRSMLVQLSSKSSSFPEEIQKLYDQCEDKKRHVTVSGLTEAFVSILKRVQPAYIVLDALDECSTIHSPEREAMLDLLKRIRAEKLCHVNVLILSRKELDIEDGLKHVHTKTLCIQNAAVDNDIRVHVRRLLADDSRLRKWSPAIKNEIESSLIHGAHGMFRWVVCQIEVLKRCLKPSVLRHALRSLPETLDETYDRILLNIPPEYEREAYAALQYLALAPCSVSVADVAEAVAIDRDCHTFDPEDRLADPFDIVEVLSSLVTYSSAQIALNLDEGSSCRYAGAERATGLRLSHYSVKEYLLSDRLRNKGASKFYISINEAHKCIAEACLTYLLWFDHPGSVSLDFILEFPFGLYAARYWYRHARIAYQSPELLAEGKDNLTSMCVDLLNPERSSSFINWLKLSDPYRFRQGTNFERTLEEMPTPLFYACYLGLREVAEILVGAGADLIGSNSGNNMSSATALNGTINGGNEAIVSLLLDYGMNVNFMSEWGRTPLHQAASCGNETIVKLLITYGAHLEARTGPIIPESVVQLPAEDPVKDLGLGLLYDINGFPADVDTRQKISLSLTIHLMTKHMFLESQYFETPSNDWTGFGDGSLLRVLLYAGDQVEINSATGWTPLHEASWSGHERVVRQLQLSGADVEAKTRYGWTAMHFAAWHGHKAVVQQLVDEGASIDVKNVYGWTPLHSASFRGHEDVVRLLLYRGADIEAETAYGWTAVFGAFAEGEYENVLALLLEKGADPNAHNSYGGTVLISTARAGAERATRLLLEKGADPSIKTVYGSTAIQEAYLRGHNTIARLLRSHTWKGIAVRDESVNASPEGDSLNVPPLNSPSPLASLVSKSAISILVVGGGNRCRSPMAEAVLGSLSRGDGRFGRIDSAGTQAKEGEEPDPRTMSAIINNGILDYYHVSREVHYWDFNKFDYILGVDHEALRVLRYMYSGDVERLNIMLFGDFGVETGEEIHDIYNDPKERFEEVFEKMVEFATGFIAQFPEKNC